MRRIVLSGTRLHPDGTPMAPRLHPDCTPMAPRPRVRWVLHCCRQATGGLAAVDKASLACGPLYTWACASVELAACLQAAAPLAAEVASLEAEMRSLSARQGATRDELGELRARLRDLDVERATLAREVHDETRADG